MEFELTISADERSQTYALYRVDTGTGSPSKYYRFKFNRKLHVRRSIIGISELKWI